MANAKRNEGAGSVLLLAGIIGLLLAGALFLWSRDTRKGLQRPLYSVSRTDERGAAVVFRLFKEAGLSPQVWNQDFTHLQEPGLLVLIAPAASVTSWGGLLSLGNAGEILPHEIEALDRWVEQGNVAVILSREANDLYYALGLIADEPEGLSGDPAEPVQPSALALHVQKLQTQTRTGFRFGRQKVGLAKMLSDEETPEPSAPIPAIPADAWASLFAKKHEGLPESQVVSAVRGRGLYVAVNDVFPASNIGLPVADNARFLLNLASLTPSGGTVWFDEYHKRNVERGFMAYLRERSLFPPLSYAVLLLLALLWRANVRFGLPQPLVADRRRDSREYVRGVASLYQTAKMGHDALATLYAEFRRRLGSALRMDGLTDLTEVGFRYEAYTGRPAQEAREILIEVEAALARSRLDEATALKLCARLSELEQALLVPRIAAAPFGILSRTEDQKNGKLKEHRPHHG